MNDILEQIVTSLNDPVLRRDVLDTFGRASDTGDFYHIKASEFIRKGGVELRVAVRAAAKVIKPKSYLGIGVRYGWSDAQAIAEMGRFDKAILIDRWEVNYAGLETKGWEYAKEQIRVMAGSPSTPLNLLPEITCFNDDSHIVLPILAGRNWKYDLAVIDGDHRATGAWSDICDVFPSISIGGAVVMDDLFPTAHENQLHLPPLPTRYPYPLKNEYSILGLWRALPEMYPEFEYWDNGDVSQPFGTAPVGIAVRVR